jgi:hypothetical protein
MTTTAYIRTLFVTLAVIASLPVSAHHSFAMFDDTKEVTLKGTVHEFQWTNPHAWLQVDVVGAGGETEQWAVEMLSPNVLGRMGWKRNSLKPGDEVTVVIHPVRTGAKGGNMVSVRDKSGVQIGGPEQ